MEYNNNVIRRQDRLLSNEGVLSLLRTGEYGVLSMIDNREDKEMAYGVPVNFAWDGKESVYIHCAPEGRKLRCLGKNASVSFCVVGKTKVILDKFTTAYQSYWNAKRKQVLPKMSEERHFTLSLKNILPTMWRQERSMWNAPLDEPM